MKVGLPEQKWSSAQNSVRNISLGEKKTEKKDRKGLIKSEGLAVNK